MRDQAKHFKITPRGDKFRLTHVPSGDYVQPHLCDFDTRKAAVKCRDRMLMAAPEWDWSDSGFLAEIPHGVDLKVWNAIYARE